MALIKMLTMYSRILGRLTGVGCSAVRGFFRGFSLNLPSQQKLTRQRKEAEQWSCSTQSLLVTQTADKRPKHM
jgi:hypothetical protein